MVFGAGFDGLMIFFRTCFIRALALSRSLKRRAAVRLHIITCSKTLSFVAHRVTILRKTLMLWRMACHCMHAVQQMLKRACIRSLGSHAFQCITHNGS